MIDDPENESPTPVARSYDLFSEAMITTLDAYRAIDVEVVILLQVPFQETDVAALYTWLYTMHLEGTTEAADQVLQRSIPLQQHLQFQSFNRRVLQSLSSTPGVSVVDPDQYLCDQDICAIGDARMPFYFDDDHLSTTGAKHLSRAFDGFFSH